MKKNILITGASGFIGSFLVEAALKKNYQTVAGIRAASSKKYITDPATKFLELDFSTDAALDRSIHDFTNNFGKIDFVIHNAGITRAKKNEAYDEVNFQNTKRFVEALKRNYQVPGKFVFMSSLAAFGPGENNSPLTAKNPQKPLTAYGRSKLKAEGFLYHTQDFPFVIINPTAVYGPRDKDVFFLLQSIQKHLEVYIGNTQQLLSFVHVQDLCEAVFLSMESPATRQNFLVSDLNVYTSKEFNQIVKTHLNKKTISLILPVAMVRLFAGIAETVGRISGNTPILNKERLKEFEAPNWSVDSSDIMQLGYAPQFGLQEGLKHTIQWYKEHGWI